MQTTHNPIGHSDTLFLDRFQKSADFINAALVYAHNSHTLEDVLKAVVKGDAQFWYDENAALVTEIIDYPQRRTLRFWLAGGDLTALKGLEQEAINWSKGWDCTACEIVGRRGWGRALKDYDEAATIFVKDY